MAGARPQSLGAALTNALGAINTTKASVQKAAADVYTPPPVEDQQPSATPAPGSETKP